jgi:hypothetical protein
VLCAALAVLAACSSSLRTTAYVPAPDETANVRVYLSNQNPRHGPVCLAVYVDDELVARHSLGRDIHEQREVTLTLPAGRHVIRVVGPGDLSATTEIVAGQAPLYVAASWWGLLECEPIDITVQDRPFGFC